MKEILLCKYGEIILKGANKRYFEDILCKELRRRAKKCGNFDISRAQSTIYIEPLDDFADIDAMFEAASKTFGIAAIGRAAVCEKNIDDIKRVTREYIPEFLVGKRASRLREREATRRSPITPWSLRARSAPRYSKPRAAGSALTFETPR
jgi:thiamine biosynthesis protein ThiI